MEDHSPQYNLSSQLRGHDDDESSASQRISSEITQTPFPIQTQQGHQESSASQRISSEIPQTLDLCPGLTHGTLGGITGATPGATTGSPQLTAASFSHRSGTLGGITGGTPGATTGSPQHVRRDISKQEGKSVASPDAGNDNEDEIALEASQELNASAASFSHRSGTLGGITGATPGAITGSPQVSMARSNKRWTAEEVAAVNNGITKHGVGKWSTIIKDPEFQTVLQNRSNVDLKDKWRNMQQALTGVQRRKQVRRDISKQEGKSVASTDAGNDNEDEIALEASQEVNTPPPPCGACRAASRKTCPENCRFKAFFTFEESKTYTIISEYFKSGKILEILSSCRASEVEACKKNMLKTAHKYNEQPVNGITEMEETRKMQEEVINKLREELAAANAICRQVAMANLPTVIPDV